MRAIAAFVLPLLASVAVLPCGAADFEITGPADPVLAEKTAVRELTEYLKRRASGGMLTVDGRKDVVFHVGRTDFAREHGIDIATLAEEQWQIRSFGNNVVLAGGGNRGTFYAVYHFLEDFCGIRWWSETEEDVPTGNLSLPKLDVSGRPAFPYRDDYRSEFAKEATSEFAVRRRLNRNGDIDIPLSLGGSYAFGRPYYCHTFNRYVNWKKLGETRSELFSLVDGKRCGGHDYNKGGQLCLSNPEVYAIIRDGLLGYATNDIVRAGRKGLSTPIAYEVSMNDNWRYCQCDGCKAEMAEGGVTAQYLDFVNRLAADLKRVRPDACVSTLAYYFTEEPPSNSVRAADNVIVKLCNTRSNLAAPFYEPGDNDIMRDLVKTWKKLAKHLFVWDYDMTFTAATYGLPFPSEFHLADKYRFYREHHVDGIFWQQTMGPDEDIPEIKFYLKSKLFEDPYVDYPKLLKRTFSEYFGPKAGSLVLSTRQRMVEAQARNRGRLLWFPQFNQWNFIRAEDLAFMNAQWDAAEKAVAHEPVFLRRVTRARSGLRRLTERRTGVMVRNLSGRPSWEFPPEKYVLNGKTNTVLVTDAAAPSGKALELTSAVTDLGSLLVAYCDADGKAKGDKTRSFSARLRVKEPSADYRWYDLGKATLAENGYFYLTKGWLVHIQLPTPDFADKTYAVRLLARRTSEGTLRIARFALVDGIGAHASFGAFQERGLCAHGGDQHDYPENTVEGVRAAIEKGAAMVEFDVQRCKSGEFICMHDGDLATTTTVTGNTWQSSFAHIRSGTIDPKKWPKFGQVKVPTFDEMIDALPREGVLLSVHCYGDANIGRDIAVKIKEKGRLHQAFIACSLPCIRKAREAVPEIRVCNMTRTGPGDRAWTDEECEAYLKTTIENKCQYLQIRRRWSPAFSRRAHAAGIKVNYCPRDCEGSDPEKLADILATDVDYVFTENLSGVQEKFKTLR